MRSRSYALKVIVLVEFDHEFGIISPSLVGFQAPPDTGSIQRAVAVDSTRSPSK